MTCTTIAGHHSTNSQQHKVLLQAAQESRHTSLTMRAVGDNFVLKLPRKCHQHRWHKPSGTHNQQENEWETGKNWYFQHKQKVTGTSKPKALGTTVHYMYMYLKFFWTSRVHIVQLYPRYPSPLFRLCKDHSSRSPRRKAVPANSILSWCATPCI